jgi:glycosyltransferase involved in cell wall biosynthesis
MLTILIPTYNRARYLKQNLQLLCIAISGNHLEAEVAILVSNNVSPDNTVDAVAEVRDAWPTVRIELVNQSENIGSVRNVLFLLGAARTTYVLYVGDDDYLDEAFLLRIVALVREDQVAVVVPSNVAVSLEGEPIGYGRDVGLPERRMEQGFMACLFFAWRGHQMSGLLFRREGLMELCRKHRIENMYLFIYLVALSALRGPAVHLTANPVKVSTPTQQAKGWSYGDDGLIGDVFVNFARLEGVGLLGRCVLEMKFLWVQYWRYAMYLKLGLPAFFRCLWKIISGPSTSPLTRILFPLILPVLLPLKGLMLAVKGELFSTLKRKVDI